MFAMPPFWLRVLRILSVIDGASFIYLLFHSIYSKRILGNAEAIQTPGMIHGAIFCGLLALLLVTSNQLRWPLRRAALVFVCALIPFAPFLLEFSLRKEQNSLKAAE
ncbi:DUF3817 domain-containing protein [bacterium]|jgi:integral membrane protein|nr:DUF3817 domain-containing protein [bacterium]